MNFNWELTFWIFYFILGAIVAYILPFPKNATLLEKTSLRLFCLFLGPVLFLLAITSGM